MHNAALINIIIINTTIFFITYTFPNIIYIVNTKRIVLFPKYGVGASGVMSAKVASVVFKYFSAKAVAITASVQTAGKKYLSQIKIPYLFAAGIFGVKLLSLFLSVSA